jgi:ectoine hydroxylase-related dioxygenase (phytanoyl-CoA dioxygenase family)
MASPTGSERFTPAEIEQYETQGYVVRLGAFSPAECDAIGAISEQLVERVVAERDGRRATAGSYVFERNRKSEVWLKWEGDTDIVHGLEPFAHVSPEMNELAYDPRFIEPMIDICQDASPILYTEKLNLKRAHEGGVNPVHQDHPYWKDVADDVDHIATAMLFIDRATKENGCLQVVPGSHHAGARQLRSDQDVFGNLEMDPDVIRDSDLVHLEVERGTLVFFGPYLVHKSEPNRSDSDRRSLLFSYQPAGNRHVREFEYGHEESTTG